MAKRLLLIDPMHGASFVEASRAMALGRIDYVEYKPGPPPNERFHEVVTGFLREWTRPYRWEANAVVRIVGERWSPRSHETRDLLERYAVPHAFYPVDSEGGRALLRSAGRTAERLPVWVLFDEHVLVDPSNEEAADVLNTVEGPPMSPPTSPPGVGRGLRRSPPPRATLWEPFHPAFEGSQAGAVLREGCTLEELACGFVDRSDGDRHLVGIDPY